ncbi:4Fe-4S dicluster domain-containing protein [Ktedonosporobacter rubrisoli]|uniref:4Fe-4S dicluster domain-containing protein n=1 Tax=Ktedonosporobacter rubrisoli TaxID=2509675 RepID=A0A4P6K482_KTERU|nr:LUD domain-containing protein [Ktedonosporobacter rubrisoli]QBD83107.1 4Fe-4S dicluster domain-containing protein [Ktedonosporobacter rubrisoli]
MTPQDQSQAAEQATEHTNRTSASSALNLQSADGEAGHKHEPFEQRLQHALEDTQIPRALGRFAPSWRASREGLFTKEEADYGPDYSFPHMRSQLRDAKDYAIEHQPELLAEFKAHAEAAGATIYEARTAEEANRYIYELCQRKGIELVVKSKTMVSEETELNAYLEQRGVKAIETDLGEWVAQLNHERPSHMVMPIIHKTRQQVGTILTQATGREISLENISEQVGVIRQEHRKAFLGAHMGVSGANALIAESGTVMMVTNEGNGRLVTSLPQVHVVMAGYEKLLGTYADAMTQLRLLARSATAQPITSYTTFITGPSSPDKEMHIILLDNGRSEMRADPRFKDALRCIRCAACANVCPPYQQVGGHAFGHIYTGAIGLVVTPFHHGLEAGAGPQSLCVSCNACETVCPVEIPLPSLILDVRHRTVEAKGLPWIKKLVFGTLARPRIFDLFTRLASLGQWPITRGSQYVRARNIGLLSRLPVMSFLEPMARWRSLPAFATRPLRDRVKKLPSKVSGQGLNLTVCYFAGCMTDRLYPEMGEAVIKVLEAVGVRVVFPQQQNCCGLPALNSGDRRNGVAMAKQTIVALEQALEENKADYILSASTSCVVTIIQDYIKLFEDLHYQGWLKQAQRLAEKVIDFTSFLERVVLPSGVKLPVQQPGASVAVTYHDSCQSCNCLGLRSEARHIIQNVLQVAVREMPQSDVCCGFGGSSSLEHPEVARRLLKNKLDNAQSTGATLLVADNPGCLMHLRGGVDADGRPIRVLHLAQLIAENMV